MLQYNDLKSYQLAAVEHIIRYPRCGLFMEMGLGKTVSTLTAFRRLKYEELDIETALIIAPKRVAESVWPDEIYSWAHTMGLTYSIIQGTETKRKAALAAKVDLYIIGRDNVAWLCSQYGGAMLPYDMVIIDESSSFKNHQSVRFKALKRAIAACKRVVLLTGTPVSNGLMDLWSQLYLLDRGDRLGKTIGEFRRKYFKQGMYDYKILPGCEAIIRDAISDICISMKTEDYSDLPEQIDNIIKISFPEKLQKQYDEFEKEQILALPEGEEISALNAATLSGKLRQFANGAIYDDDKNYHIVHDLKLDALEELIEDAGGKPVLIAWVFRHDMYRIQERLNKYHPRQLSTKKDIEDWNNGKLRILMMHPASGGHGLNLQFGGHIIVKFGQDWSLELDQQFNARLRRPGQKNTVIINRLVAHSTIESDVVKALNSKSATQYSLMEAIKMRIDKYIHNR